MGIAPNWAAKRDDFLLQNRRKYSLKGLRFWPIQPTNAKSLNDIHPLHPLNFGCTEIIWYDLGFAPAKWHHLVLSLAGLSKRQHTLSHMTATRQTYSSNGVLRLPDFFQRCEAPAACDKLWISCIHGQQAELQKPSSLWMCNIFPPNCRKSFSKSHIKHWHRWIRRVSHTCSARNASGPGYEYGYQTFERSNVVTFHKGWTYDGRDDSSKTKQSHTAPRLIDNVSCQHLA